MKFFLLLTLISLLAACSSKIKNPHFYEMSRDGKNFYILGTIHMGVSFDELPDTVQSKIKSAKVAYFEVDDRTLQTILFNSSINMITYGKQLLTSQSGKSHPSRALSKRISPQAFHIIQSNYPKNTDSLSPSAAFILLQEKYPKVARVSSIVAEHSKYSLDAELMKMSHFKEKRQLDNRDIYEKSSEESELTALEKCFDEIYSKSIEEYISNTAEKTFDDMEELRDKYITGDPSTLMKVVNEHLNVDKNLCLLKERNQYWMKSFTYAIPFAQTDSTLFAFGAAHLYGEDGVLNLLKKEGYEFKRISLQE